MYLCVNKKRSIGIAYSMGMSEMREQAAMFQAEQDATLSEMWAEEHARIEAEKDSPPNPNPNLIVPHAHASHKTVAPDIGVPQEGTPLKLGLVWERGVGGMVG
eukprot:NODE_2661_length_887_cov_30.105012_g2191_i0.p2 GENE.NODE_2661_length_887_cov_30.105012_g2191_i0~~NODE_2661_length_887_cov_30.105012_g2191_i0.p2  ORF type:complete len:103 (+),score=23.16 NODE_2661_length_887_cov_30.105012_g2191_i0:80-388(+)